VKWVDSWEPEDNLSEACQALIDEFWSSPIHDPSGGEVDRADLKVSGFTIECCMYSIL